MLRRAHRTPPGETPASPSDQRANADSSTKLGTTATRPAGTPSSSRSVRATSPLLASAQWASRYAPRFSSWCERLQWIQRLLAITTGTLASRAAQVAITLLYRSWLCTTSKRPSRSRCENAKICLAVATPTNEGTGTACTGTPAASYRARIGPSALRLNIVGTARPRMTSSSAVRTAFCSVPPGPMLSRQNATRSGRARVSVSNSGRNTAAPLSGAARTMTASARRA
jgi:hypothetical protein